MISQKSKVKSQKFTKSAGFGIIEIIVAMGIMIIIAATGASTVLHSFSANRLGDEETNATLFAQEGIEAARSIKNQGWANLSAGTYGLDSSGGTWTFSGTSNTSGKYTRQVVISEVQRDAGGAIVESGGTVDPDTLKTSSTATWEFSPTRNNSVSLVTYLTNFEKPIGLGNWANPYLLATLDLQGSSDGKKIQVQGDYAYLIRKGGDPDFVTIDITNPANPFVVAEAALNGSPKNIAVSGNYAYVVTSHKSQEFKVFDISSPSVLNLVGGYNAPGDANAMGVYVVGTTAYVVRKESSQDEFLILDVSNPSSPAYVGSTGLADDGEEVVVLGNYAYVGTDSDSRELEVVDISNPSSPQVVGSYNASGSSNSQSIDGFGNTVILGRNSGHTHIFDVSSPTSPVQVAYYDADDDVEDIDVYVGTSFTYAFLGTDESDEEFQLLDITTPSSPTLVGSLDVANQINGIAYHEGKDRVFAASEAGNAELMVFAPQ